MGNEKLMAEAREEAANLRRQDDTVDSRIANLLDRMATALEGAPRIEAGDGWIKVWQGDKLVLTVSSSTP